MPKLVVMLRVKDGIFFAKEWLACFEKIADEIVVLDNGSTDGTYELLKAHPKVVDTVRTEGYNEGRDKNLMYSHVRLRKPDWCLWVDIDELFEPTLTRRHFDKLMGSRFVTQFAFRRFHFIDREYFAASWFRLNYTAGPDRIMWREQATGYFENFLMDSPNVKGITGLKLTSNFRIKHMGYVNKAIVDQKKKLYLDMLAEDKKAALGEMYLDQERRMKWHDNRRHIKVILLNGLLNAMLMKQYADKIVHRTKRFFSNRMRKRGATPSVSANS